MAFSLVLGMAAEADELFTADVAVTGNRDFDCRITNVSDAPRTVRMQIVNADNGAIVADTGTFTLASHRGRDRSMSDPNLALFCHFSVVGIARNVRAIGCVGVNAITPAPCPLGTRWVE
jgi:hypothetical protein